MIQRVITGVTEGTQIYIENKILHIMGKEQL